MAESLEALAALDPAKSIVFVDSAQTADSRGKYLFLHHALHAVCTDSELEAPDEQVRGLATGMWDGLAVDIRTFWRDRADVATLLRDRAEFLLTDRSTPLSVDHCERALDALEEWKKASMGPGMMEVQVHSPKRRDDKRHPNRRTENDTDARFTTGMAPDLPEGIPDTEQSRFTVQAEVATSPTSDVFVKSDEETQTSAQTSEASQSLTDSTYETHASSRSSVSGWACDDDLSEVEKAATALELESYTHSVAQEPTTHLTDAPAAIAHNVACTLTQEESTEADSVENTPLQRTNKLETLLEAVSLQPSIPIDNSTNLRSMALNRPVSPFIEDTRGSASLEATHLGGCISDGFPVQTGNEFHPGQTQYTSHGEDAHAIVEVESAVEHEQATNLLFEDDDDDDEDDKGLECSPPSTSDAIEVEAEKPAPFSSAFDWADEVQEEAERMDAEIAKCMMEDPAYDPVAATNNSLTQQSPYYPVSSLVDGAEGSARKSGSKGASKAAKKKAAKGRKLIFSVAGVPPSIPGNINPSEPTSRSAQQPLLSLSESEMNSHQAVQQPPQRSDDSGATGDEGKNLFLNHALPIICEDMEIYDADDWAITVAFLMWDELPRQAKRNWADDARGLRSKSNLSSAYLYNNKRSAEKEDLYRVEIIKALGERNDGELKYLQDEYDRIKRIDKRITKANKRAVLRDAAKHIEKPTLRPSGPKPRRV